MDLREVGSDPGDWIVAVCTVGLTVGVAYEVIFTWGVVSSQVDRLLSKVGLNDGSHQLYLP